jgi:Domain of unknown function (DUF305)
MFAQHMIPHHQQAVDMAAMVPSHTANPTLRVVAIHMLGVAPEPVEFPDREGVTLTEMVQASVQLWAVGRRTADTVVDEDANGTNIIERVELQLRVLVGRAAAAPSRS